jgi:phage shock protein PspC (stress-responsive transcriptional regulator)
MTNDRPASEPVPPGGSAEASVPSDASGETTASGDPADGTPPPYGPPPSGGPGWARRYGLERPAHGRYLAGVCAAVARATNTDPVLWRVLVAVLTLFGGIGLLLYLLGWLLIPAEGDTASPFESLLGRGHSCTSSVTTIVMTAFTVLLFFFVINDRFRVAILGVGAVIAVLVLFGRDNARQSAWRGQPGGFGEPPVAAQQPWPAPSSAPPPAAAVPSMPPAPAGPGGYRPPFAPYGPYASFPPAPAGGPPAPSPVAPPRPPKPPREPSRLGRVVLSLMCVALGMVAVFDLATGEVPAPAYIAVALAVTGLGLLVGAWLGRARWLIAVGLVLTVALVIAGAVENDRIRDYREHPSVVWQPTSVAQIDASYRQDFGNATLDLREVDFTTASQPVKVDVSLDVGRLQILLPNNVDVDITGDVGVGDADVLGDHWGGIDTPRQRVQDDGLDGPGGGQLVLTASIDAGNLEVRR